MCKEKGFLRFFGVDVRIHFGTRFRIKHGSRHGPKNKCLPSPQIVFFRGTRPWAQFERFFGSLSTPLWLDLGSSWDPLGCFRLHFAPFGFILAALDLIWEPFLLFCSLPPFAHARAAGNRERCRTIKEHLRKIYVQMEPTFE